jgi:hypothetical protein
MSLITQISRGLLLLSGKCRGKSKEDTTHNVKFAIMLYYSQIQKRLVKLEIYSVSVALHILHALVILQREDQLNRAD